MSGLIGRDRAAGVIGRIFNRFGVRRGCAALALALPAVARAQQPIDLNSDGVADTIRREIRLHPTDPVISRIVLVSGTDGSAILPVHSKTPNDLFGWFIAPVGDLDLDGVPDLAVTAPASMIEEARSAEHPQGPRRAPRPRRPDLRRERLRARQHPES